ncbi:hypothetical protein HT819_003910 [Salmonella enterica]|nr:hypothetical protein [Salmonella enterica]
MKRTLLAVVVTAVVAPMAHASNADVLAFLQKTKTIASEEHYYSMYPGSNSQSAQDSLKNQYTEAHNAFENLNARDRMVVTGIADKVSYPGLGGDFTGVIQKVADSRYNPANVPAGWDQAKTQAFIDAAHGITTPAPAPAMAPVAAPVDVVDHAQVQSIKENITQVIKMASSEQPGSPVYIALQQKLTDLSSQLKSAQSAIPATTLEAAKPPVVYVDEQPKGEEPRQPHEVPDQTVKASELTPATKPADKPQDVIPASTLTPATKPAATVDNSTQAHLDNNVPESVKVNARLTNLEKAAAQAKPAVTTNDPAQVVNNYTISGMTAKQAAQQQDNTDQILSHSRAIASNRDAIQQNSQKIDRLQSQQDTDRKAAKAGTANALAVSGLHYVDTDNSIAIGAGTYEGQNAGSIGYRHKFSQNVAATIAASQDSNGGTGAAASLAVGW